MRFALGNHFIAIAFVAATSATFAQPASAEDAFITQAGGKGAIFGRSVDFHPVTPKALFSYAPPPHSAPNQPTPETTVPATGGNWASTLEMGKYNVVLQAQSGLANLSKVGILGGTRDRVNVLQEGRGLISNLWLLNTAGLSVNVIQPAGSAPVNMLIAKLPNGALLIRR